LGRRTRGKEMKEKGGKDERVKRLAGGGREESTASFMSGYHDAVKEVRKFQERKPEGERVHVWSKRRRDNTFGERKWLERGVYRCRDLGMAFLIQPRLGER